MSDVPIPSIGSHIDALGLHPNLAAGELIESAIVILKVIEVDGTVRLATAWSTGMSWIERYGMISVAEQTQRPTG